jgi:hypothetical protein
MGWSFNYAPWGGGSGSTVGIWNARELEYQGFEGMFPVDSGYELTDARWDQDTRTFTFAFSTPTGFVDAVLIENPVFLCEWINTGAIDLDAFVQIGLIVFQAGF